MRIIKCHITNFGCYSDQTFDFSVKLNPYCLNNGAGKTTLATFIKAMFYSLEKSSTKSYEREHYKPYSGGIYGGSLEIELDGQKYRIERTFSDSPTKDTLKIYNEHGEVQTTFLSKSLSSLQGAASSLLGELIFGIDVASFLRCNFISSNDLDFSSNETIKMKIGNIMMDRDRENSYEDTRDSIKKIDLREKEPTRKNENAYPYQINQLKNDNKNKQREIEELNQLEENLQNLYDERDVIKKELDGIEKKQKELSYQHTQKGKLSTIEQYDQEIEDKKQIVDEITNTYNGNIPSKPEIDSLKENLDKYNECIAIDRTYNITPADISRLEELNGKVISDDDYERLADANSKLSGSNNNGWIQIDDLKFNELKNKFEGKSLKNETELDNEFIEYRGLLRDQSGFGSNYHAANIDYPSENVLQHIESEIDHYNTLLQEVNDIKSSYKEPSVLIKILLIIFTLGIFLVVLNKKKKAYVALVTEKEKAVDQVAGGLTGFFAKYNKNNGTYELRLAELRDEIANYVSSKSEQEEKTQKYNELSEKIRIKKDSLNSYFFLFGYETSNVDTTYNQYKKDLSEYNTLKRDSERNEEISKGVKEITDELNQTIDSILSKYKVVRRDDFSKQLNEMKDNLDFFKKYNPIHINKKSNDDAKFRYENKMVAVLKNHNIVYDNDFILVVRNVIHDFKTLNDAKERKIDLIEKKDKFIKDNHLEGFVAENIEQDEEKLRTQRESKAAELSAKEDEINQNEERISKRESIQDAINDNLDKIKEYEEKVEIATLALAALDLAHSEIEDKFINPIKESFVSYAKKIYEKIGTNINMNYDYVVTYNVKGQEKESKDLSDGERTIMMLALRFSVLDSMYKNHDSLIILDDPFESLDPDKLGKAKELIKELSNEWQIIYFTCHESRAV